MQTNVPQPQAVLRGHRGEVQALDFDPSERYLVTGDSLGEVRIWNLRDLRPTVSRRLHSLTGGILALHLFQCGGQTLLATQGRDGVTLLWSCDSQDLQLPAEPVRVFERDCYSFCRLAVLSAGPEQESPLQVHSSAAAEQLRRQQEEELLASQFIAAVLKDDAAANGTAEAAQATSAAESCSTAGDIATAKAAAATAGPAAAAAASRLPPTTMQQDGQQAVGSQRVAAAIWAVHPCALSTREQPPALLAVPGSDERTAEVVCCGCGQQVAEFREAAAGRKLGMLMAVQLCCVQLPASAPKHSQATSTPPATVALDRAACSTAVDSSTTDSTGICLVGGYEDGSVVVWQLGLAPGAPPLMQRQLCREPVMALQIDSTAAGGAAGSAEDQIVAFRLDYDKRKISVRHAIELQRKGIGDVAVRPDRRLLVTAGWDSRVRIYKYRSGRPLAILKYHTSPVTGIRFAPRSMLLATAARDGTVALWPLFQPEALT